MEPVPPAVEVQSPNHWTAREVPDPTSFDITIFSLSINYKCFLVTLWFLLWTMGSQTNDRREHGWSHRIFIGPELKVVYITSRTIGQNSVIQFHLTTAETRKCNLAVGSGRKWNRFGEHMIWLLPESILLVTKYSFYFYWHMYITHSPQVREPKFPSSSCIKFNPKSQSDLKSSSSVPDAAPLCLPTPSLIRTEELQINTHTQKRKEGKEDQLQSMALSDMGILQGRHSEVSCCAAENFSD